MTTETALMLPWSYGQQPIVFFWIYGQEANCKLFCLKSQNTRKRTGTINPPAVDSFYTPSPPRYSHLKRSRMKEKWFGEFLPNGPKSAPGGQKNGPNFIADSKLQLPPPPPTCHHHGWLGFVPKGGPATLIRPLFKWSLPISCHFLFYLNAFVYHRFAWIHTQLELSVVNLTTILVMGNHFLCLCRNISKYHLPLKSNMIFLP